MQLELDAQEIPPHLQKYFEPVPGPKPKDALGIPWMVAFALRADGWYLRSEIIWHKKAPMPESVQDRPTKAHEQLFLLSKSPKYFYDAEAIREPNSETSQTGGQYRNEWKYAAIGHGSSTSVNRIGEPIPRNGRNKRSVWTLGPEQFQGSHFACVDQDTECLTIEGWKKYSELRPGLLAAQYDMATNRLTWAAIEEIATYPVVNQPMVLAKSRNVEMMLTPNHRTIISRREPRGNRAWKKLSIIRADELKPSHSIPISGEWDDIPGSCPISPDWAELIGWYIAEGCETIHSWTVEIYQSISANPEKVERIRTLLNAVGAEFSSAQFDRVANGKPHHVVTFQIKGFAAAFLRQYAPGKNFHPDTLQWPEPILRRLFDGLIDGDGHRRIDDQRISYVQANKYGVDMVHAIGFRLGYAATVARRSEGTWHVHFTEKRLLSFRGTAGEGAQIEMVPYTGIVWCPKLPAGTWVARKNGRAFITGNTMPTKLVEPCILAGTSAHGACSNCGAPWARVVERELVNTEGWGKAVKDHTGNISGSNASIRNGNGRLGDPITSTVGWAATCACGNADVVPCVVLDCFSGSGTTGAVALKHNRHYIGLELNEDYISLAHKRIGKTQPMLLEVTA